MGMTVITDKRLIAIVNEFASADVCQHDKGNNVICAEIQIGIHQVCQMFTTIVAFFPNDLVKYVPDDDIGMFLVYTTLVRKEN